MCHYEEAITRQPCANFADGLTHGLLGRPSVELAVEQHRCYVDALIQCGVNVTVLPPEDAYPDSCFTEDETVVTDRMAVQVAPCRPSRQGEEKLIRPIVEKYYAGRIEEIRRPGTLEGGDICRAGNHFFIGISSRPNEEGARQMAEIPCMSVARREPTFRIRVSRSASVSPWVKPRTEGGSLRADSGQRVPGRSARYR